MDCAKHDIADGGRQYVLGADLNDTRTARPQNRQQHAEIHIVRNNDPVVCRGEIEDLRIGRRWVADG